MYCEFTCHAGVEFVCDVYFNLLPEHQLNQIKGNKF